MLSPTEIRVFTPEGGLMAHFSVRVFARGACNVLTPHVVLSTRSLTEPTPRVIHRACLRQFVHPFHTGSGVGDSFALARNVARSFQP